MHSAECLAKTQPMAALLLYRFYRKRSLKESPNMTDNQISPQLINVI